MKYLLIDSNNLACRNSFANDGMLTSRGEVSGVHYGIFQSLIGLKFTYPDYQFLMAWDGKSKRRMDESKNAVEKNIIPSVYKANRKKEEMPIPLKNFYENADIIKRGIGVTTIPQIRLPDFEADDVIYSYCHFLKNEGHEVICITSDKDYYALLDDNVSVYDGMKKMLTTKDSFVADFGIQPHQWTDVGALMGDEGDNIFGVPGVGDKTAAKEIKKYGSYQKTLEDYESKYGHLKEKYVELPDNEEGRKIFDELSKKYSNPDAAKPRLKYPQIYWGMPYSGVIKAFDDGLVDIPKNVLLCLAFQNRIKLAYSLKKMDIIEDLPVIEPNKADVSKLKEFFEYFEFKSLMDNIGKLTFDGI